MAKRERMDWPRSPPDYEPGDIVDEHEIRLGKLECAVGMVWLIVQGLALIVLGLILAWVF